MVHIRLTRWNEDLLRRDVFVFVFVYGFEKEKDRRVAYIRLTRRWNEDILRRDGQEFLVSRADVKIRVGSHRNTIPILPIIIIICVKQMAWKGKWHLKRPREENGEVRKKLHWVVALESLHIFLSVSLDLFVSLLLWVALSCIALWFRDLESEIKKSCLPTSAMAHCNVINLQHQT